MWEYSGEPGVSATHPRRKRSNRRSVTVRTTGSRSVNDEFRDHAEKVVLKKTGELECPTLGIPTNVHRLIGASDSRMRRMRISSPVGAVNESAYGREFHFDCRLAHSCFVDSWLLESRRNNWLVPVSIVIAHLVTQPIGGVALWSLWSNEGPMILLLGVPTGVASLLVGYLVRLGVDHMRTTLHPRSSQG